MNFTLFFALIFCIACVAMALGDSNDLSMSRVLLAEHEPIDYYESRRFGRRRFGGHGRRFGRHGHGFGGHGRGFGGHGRGFGRRFGRHGRRFGRHGRRFGRHGFGHRYGGHRHE